MHYLFSLQALVALALTIALPSAVSAQHPEWREQESSFCLAREAVARGEALPLQQVRDSLQQLVPGQIVATHYEYEFERWVYEFKVIDTAGQLRKVHLDARTGELVRVSDY